MHSFSLKQFEQIINAITDGVCVLDRDYHVVLCNESFRFLYGWENEAPLGQVCTVAFRKDNCEETLCPVKKLFSTGEPVEMSSKYEKANQSGVQDCHLSVKPLFDESGEIEAAVVNVQDISDVGGVIEAFKEFEERYRAVVENVGEGIAVVDEKENILYANSAAEEIFGVKPGRLFGASVLDFLDDENRALVRRESENRRMGLKGSYELFITRADGERRHLEATVTPQFDKQNRFTRAFGIFRDITEQKHAQRRVHESEEKYRNLVELSVDGICIIQEDKIVFANQELAKLLGRDVSEILDSPFSEFVTDESWVRLIDILKKHHAGARDLGIIDATLISNTGKEILVEINGSIIDFEGAAAEMVTIRDVTQRKLVEEKAKEIQLRYQRLAENARDLVWQTDVRGTVLYVNKAVTRMLGFTMKEAIGLPAEKYLTRSSIKEIGQWIESRFGEHPDGDQLFIEIEYKTKDKRTIPAELNITLGRDGDGKILTVEGISRDISERKRAEEELKESEEKFRGIFEGAPIGIFHSTLDGKILNANPAMARMLGCESSGELKNWLNRPSRESSWWSSVESQAMILDDALRDGQWTSYHIDLEGKSGQKVLTKLTVRAIRDRRNNRPRLEGFVEDVTSRVKAKKALEASERRYSDIINFLPDATFVIDREGKVIAWNEAIEEMTGIQADEMLGKNDYAYAIPFHGERRKMLVNRILDSAQIGEGEENANEGISRVSEAFAKNLGEMGRFVSARAKVLYDAEGQIVGAIESLRDITERVEAREQMEHQKAQLQRSNEELQQFAYIASHDLQEPLRSISSYVQLLKRRYQGKLDKNADEFIDFATEGVAQMHDLIKDLLAYSRVTTQAGRFIAIDATKIAQQALRALRVSIEESNAEIQLGELGHVLADPSQLAQVFLNLIGNAIKFRGEKKPQIVIRAEKRDAFTEITVKDNGIGIDSKYNERIFQMFQRLHAKSEYSGTGIGLAVCKKIIERHGGEIWLESEENQGTVFYFTLPVGEEKS